jgi:hypothetical protein
MGLGAAGTAAAIGAVGSVASAGASLLAGDKAAAGAQQSAQLQAQRYTQTRADLSPFTQAGTDILPDLTTLARSGPNGPGGTNFLAQAQGMLPGQMTQAELEATPGYKFNLSQGLQATQNAAAARGLGVSGAALRGAATYATGLADSTYQNQFANAQQRFTDVGGLNTIQQGNLQNQYARLQGVASLGENAGAQTGSIGATLANQQGNALIAAGNANAAGTLGVGNALNSGAQNYLGYQALQGYLSNGSTSGYNATGTGGPNDTTRY